MKFTEIQLTFDPGGHCLNSTQCFSADDQWIVFDGRNEDRLIGQNSLIAMVNTSSGEVRTLYKTSGQTEYGPGVGAATFSPIEARVLFIHGIRNANAQRPYAITRRTGVSVWLNKPGEPVFMDARDILPPFTNGALRGGTHAHTWSGDGQWISFTYNDHIIAEASKKNAEVADLRTIGIMVPGAKVTVPDNAQENNDGELFSMLVVAVTEKPAQGTDEIDKAFDETWIGMNGYRKPDGSRQHKAIAYQGNLRDINGQPVTEIFVVDIPDNILELAAGASLQGTVATRPPLPSGLRHRRISFTKKGVSAIPRHWLRSSADGSVIAFLAEDDRGYIQLFTISPNGGEPLKLTDFGFSIQGPVNFSADGRCIAYVADNSVFITEIDSRRSVRVTARTGDANRPVGAVNWSHNDKMLCYNRYMTTDQGSFLQIFLLKEA